MWPFRQMIQLLFRYVSFLSRVSRKTSDCDKFHCHKRYIIIFQGFCLFVLVFDTRFLCSVGACPRTLCRQGWPRTPSCLCWDQRCVLPPPGRIFVVLFCFSLRARVSGSSDASNSQSSCLCSGLQMVSIHHYAQPSLFDFLFWDGVLPNFLGWPLITLLSRQLLFEFTVLLPQAPNYWDCRPALLGLAC